MNNALGIADPATMLCALLVAHAVCDYPLQGDFLARAKNPKAPLAGVPWQWAMAAHCAIHAGAVGLVTGCGVVAVGEFVAHWAIDDQKCRGKITFAQDQFAHVLCKLVWLGAWLWRELG